MSATSDLGDAEEITLSLPARPQFARVARLTVTGLASRVGFTYDEIEDLRIAVGEVCSLLLPGPEGRLTFRCRVEAGAVAVRATREPVGRPIEAGDLSRQILLAVVDELELDAEAGSVRVAKRHRG
ncbi:MAG: hypothetical protein R2746_14765 [Acidimicrobiales bacterium]|nr:hypothetical protein [Actinomycetota bacterium]